CVIQSGYCTWNSYCEDTPVVEIVNQISCRIQIHILRCGSRGFLPEVESCHRAVLVPVYDETAAADISRRRPGHRKRKGRGHRRIDCIASLLQYSDAHIRRNCRCGYDHPIFSIMRVLCTES